MNNEEYNGWSNYETWNVGLWIGSDEGLYGLAGTFTSFEDMREYLRSEQNFIETLDRVSLWDSALDLDELNEMVANV